MFNKICFTDCSKTQRVSKIGDCFDFVFIIIDIYEPGQRQFQIFYAKLILDKTILYFKLNNILCQLSLLTQNMNLIY